jgi:tetratricopeptide (TPR) repeat protein
MTNYILAALAALAVLTAAGFILMKTPAWKSIQLRRAAALAASGRIEDMIRLLQRNRDRKSVKDPLTNALVYFLIRAGRFAEAEDAVAEAVQKGDSSGTALGQLGLIESGRGNAAQAEQYYRKALEKEPELAGSLGVNLAGLLIEKRDEAGLDEAGRLLQEALEIRTGASRSGVHINLSLLGLARSQPRDALVHAMTAYELMPPGDHSRGSRAQALALAARASSLLGDGGEGEALELARKALSLLEGLAGFEKLHDEIEEMLARLSGRGGTGIGPAPGAEPAVP